MPDVLIWKRPPPPIRRACVQDSPWFVACCAKPPSPLIHRACVSGFALIVFKLLASFKQPANFDFRLKSSQDDDLLPK